MGEITYISHAGPDNPLALLAEAILERALHDPALGDTMLLVSLLSTALGFGVVVAEVDARYAAGLLATQLGRAQHAAVAAWVRRFVREHPLGGA